MRLPPRLNPSRGDRCQGGECRRQARERGDCRAAVWIVEFAASRHIPEASSRANPRRGDRGCVHRSAPPPGADGRTRPGRGQTATVGSKGSIASIRLPWFRLAEYQFRDSPAEWAGMRCRQRASNRSGAGIVSAGTTNSFNDLFTTAGGDIAPPASRCMLADSDETATIGATITFVGRASWPVECLDGLGSPSYRKP